MEALYLAQVEEKQAWKLSLSLTLAGSYKMLLKLFQQSRFFKSISGLGNVASPSHGFVGTRASRPPAVFGTHYLRLLATDSSPPNDTIGPQYGDPVRLPGYPQLVDFSTAKTQVWWDTENSPVPRGFDAYRIGGNIRNALNENGYRGPISIRAFGNMRLIPTPIQLALTSTGIDLYHVPGNKVGSRKTIKDASDFKIIGHVLTWIALNHPQPSNLMVITGDRDYSVALHQLRCRSFNILLACPESSTSTALLRAATSVWKWNSLILGQKPLAENEIEDLIAAGLKK